jgi:hypothetical protein
MAVLFRLEQPVSVAYHRKHKQSREPNIIGHALVDITAVKIQKPQGPD